ncbi:Enoyl-[acyl-carrier-protein] reductase [NADH] FabI [Pseudodesulfovibrio hydrargyri]|uniref:Enoyl-[acyl-carrier-protein] reductase [NADH] n=1 Tax=Pseudodesulfovibrio hydrargyri TaxID=2125990 RepID=A0A1J5MVS7_9BACT|nr:enoyl-ACP reductase [Pseudodesulfovibrio hydrargyri]OIQ49916.1 Enoyl-[acyl-carrier-protein] reductase [NADH] FabI [Pseudodesulfovibrio hydrargyri]
MLLKDKKALIFGVVNDRSIAYGIAKQFKEHGARLAFSYAADPIERRLAPICEELGGEFMYKCDVTSDDEIAAGSDLVREKWGDVDILVHSIAYANREDLKGRFIDTSREGYKVALDVSSFSLVALCRAFEPLLKPGSSVLTMSYYGAGKVVANYNAMGVAKAALEACVRYLSVDLGEKGVRINAISAGPVKTMAASGISGFKTILGRIEEKSPLHRNITIDDVGKCALYLASDLSSGTTGDVIFVDSGYNIMGV